MCGLLFGKATTAARTYRYHRRLFQLATHLETLGMRQTGFMVPESDRRYILPMHGTRDIGQIIDDVNPDQRLSPIDVDDTYPCDNPDFLRGGHGLFSTLDDYERFMDMLFDGQGGAERFASRACGRSEPSRKLLCEHDRADCRCGGKRCDLSSRV